MADERFVESKYENCVYDTLTEKDYQLTDENIICKELIPQLDDINRKSKQLMKETRWRQEQMMKRDMLINQLLKEVYLSNPEPYASYDEYLKENLKSKLEMFEINDLNESTNKEEVSTIQLKEDMKRQKQELIIKWADQIDEISELLIQKYNIAEKDEYYDLMEMLDEIIDEFETIDSRYIKNR